MMINASINKPSKLPPEIFFFFLFLAGIGGFSNGGELDIAIKTFPFKPETCKFNIAYLALQKCKCVSHVD